MKGLIFSNQNFSTVVSCRAMTKDERIGDETGWDEAKESCEGTT